MSVVDTIAGNVNLDGIPEDDLSTLWGEINRGPVKAARILFPDRPKGYVSATHTLSAYAINKSSAISCRKEGNIRGATAYEDACEIHYSTLPEFARW